MSAVCGIRLVWFGLVGWRALRQGLGTLSSRRTLSFWYIIIAIIIIIIIIIIIVVATTPRGRVCKQASEESSALCSLLCLVVDCDSDSDSDSDSATPPSLWRGCRHVFFGGRLPWRLFSPRAPLFIF